MSRLAVSLFLVFGLGAWSQVLANENCPPGAGIEMSGGPDASWTINVRFDPEEVPLNRPFNADVTVCSQSEAPPDRITVDATMPAHKHGMNYDPKMVKIDDRHYEIEDLLFHMPGVWRLEVTAYGDDKPHRFTHELNVQ